MNGLSGCVTVSALAGPCSGRPCASTIANCARENWICSPSSSMRSDGLGRHGRNLICRLLRLLAASFAQHRVQARDFLAIFWPARVSIVGQHLSQITGDTQNCAVTCHLRPPPTSSFAWPAARRASWALAGSRSLPPCCAGRFSIASTLLRTCQNDIRRIAARMSSSAVIGTAGGAKSYWSRVMGRGGGRKRSMSTAGIFKGIRLPSLCAFQQ